MPCRSMLYTPEKEKSTAWFLPLLHISYSRLFLCFATKALLPAVAGQNRAQATSRTVYIATVCDQSTDPWCSWSASFTPLSPLPTRKRSFGMLHRPVFQSSFVITSANQWLRLIQLHSGTLCYREWLVHIYQSTRRHKPPDRNHNTQHWEPQTSKVYNNRFQVRSQNWQERLFVSFVMSVCLSVFRPHGTTQLPTNRFTSNLIFQCFFRKSVEKIQVSLKSDNNNGYFTFKRFHIYDNISLNSS